MNLKFFLNLGPSDSNIANSLTINNNAKLSQIAAHNKMLENSLGYVAQKPSINSISNTNSTQNINNNSNISPNYTIQKTTNTTNITFNPITTSEDKYSNSNLVNITNNKSQNFSIANNSNASLEAQNKPTVTKIPISISQVNNQVSEAITTPAPNSISNPGVKVESIAKSQETVKTNFPSQIPISNPITTSAYNNNLIPQKSLSGKFNIISANNSATQSSSNVNISLPSNTLSSNNLNIKGKSSLQHEAAGKTNEQKNEEFISYDTESNDSSPRTDIVGNAMNSRKNVSVNVINNAGSGVNYLSAYSASQGKTITEGNNNNTNSVNNVNSTVSEQTKSLKVSFPITRVIEEKGK